MKLNNVFVLISLVVGGVSQGHNAVSAGSVPIESLKMNDIKEIKSLPEQYNIMPSAVVFSPDHMLLAIRTSDHKINVWDWQNGKISSTLELPSASGDSGVSETLQFDPAGKYLAACHSRASDSTVVTLWSTVDWTIAYKIKDHSPGSGCNAIGFTPDGKNLVRLLDRPPGEIGDTLVVYGVADWKIVVSKKTDLLMGKALSVSPDGTRLAIAGNAFVNRKDGSEVSSGAISIFAIDERPTIEILDIESLRTLKSIPASIPVSSTGRLRWRENGFITNFHNGDLESFDALSGRQTLVAKSAIKETVGSFMYTPDGNYLISTLAGKAGELQIWDASHKKILYSRMENAGSIDISKDGKYLAVATYGKTKIFEIKYN
jgi:WD40 repeat protein